MILGLPGEHFDPVKQLLKTGSEQLCIPLPHRQQFILYLVPKGTDCSRDILEREVLHGFHRVCQILSEGKVSLEEGDWQGLQVGDGEKQGCLNSDVLHLRVVFGVHRPKAP